LPLQAAAAAPSRTWRGLTYLLFLCLFGITTVAAGAEITVHATRDGEVLQVEASAEFEGSIARTWQILTDYGRLAEFVPDLQSSRVVSREGSNAVVEQKGQARLLFFSYPMDVRLAVTEFPHERIVSQAIAGNFREMRCTYTLEMREGRVLLRYSGRLVPDFYVPPFMRTYLLRRHVEDTFRALVEEIERQHTEPAPPAKKRDS
jgi:hypothetical protein